MISDPEENSNGLSDKEKVDLLFKNKMETASTSKDIEFFSETEANHSNMYATGILAETPPKDVSYTTSISNSKDLESSMRGEHVFADNWYDDHIHSDGSSSIEKDDENIVMRFEKIKLDYYGNQSAAFVCFDSSGNNILKNLIPSTYASGYGVTLWYDSSGEWKIIHWLESIDTLNDIYDDVSFSFGGALLDTKNGIVTFYDISGNHSTIFEEVDGNLYLSATKYIGETGFGEFQINDNGISDKEKLDILFKKHLNVASTTSDLEFFEESNLHHKNLFSDGLLTETPPENVSWNDLSNSDYSDISNILGNEFNIDQSWFDDKTDSTDVSSAFKVDSSNIVMRFEKIRLDYLENHAFACLDKERTNMLKNLIPRESEELFYKGERVDWHTSIHELRENMEVDISFGGALLDTNNGLVTFYDVDGDANSVFNDISNDLYLTVTKYIGNRGLDTFKHDVKIEKNVTIDGTLDVSNILHTKGDLEVSGNVTIDGSTTIIKGNLTINNKLDISNEIHVHKPITFDSIMAVKADISSNSKITAHSFHGDGSDLSGVAKIDASNNLTVYGNLNFVGGGIITVYDPENSTQITLTQDEKTSDSLLLQNEGTNTALIVNQTGTNSHDIARFQDISNDVFVIGANGNTTIEGTLNVHDEVDINSKLNVHDEVVLNSKLNVHDEVVLNSTLHVRGETTFSTVSGQDIIGTTIHGGSIIPISNELYDLGSVEYKFKSLYLADSTLFIGTQQMKASTKGMVFDAIDVGDTFTCNTIGIGGVTITKKTIHLYVKYDSITELPCYRFYTEDDDSSGNELYPPTLYIDTQYTFHLLSSDPERSNYVFNISGGGESFVISSNSGITGYNETITISFKNVPESPVFYFGSHISYGDTSNVSFDVQENSSVPGITIDGDVLVGRDIEATRFIGDGSQLTNVSASHIPSTIDVSSIVADGTISAKQFTGDGSSLTGVATLDNSNNMTLHGNLTILQGGNLIIEDLNSTTLGTLTTEVQRTEVLSITNNGTVQPALTVNQSNTTTQDIAHFQDNSVNVFRIKKSGDTEIHGTLEVATLDVSDTVTFHDTLHSANIIPLSDNTFDLGSSTHKFKDLYLSGTTIHLGSQEIISSENGLEVDDLHANSVRIGATAISKTTIHVYAKFHGYSSTNPPFELYTEDDENSAAFTPTLYADAQYVFHRLSNDPEKYNFIFRVGGGGSSLILSSDDGILGDDELTVALKDVPSEDVYYDTSGGLQYVQISGTSGVWTHLQTAFFQVEANLPVGGININGNVSIDKNLDVREILHAKSNVDISGSLTVDGFVQIKNMTVESVVVDTLQFAETIPSVENETGSLGNLRFNTSRDLLEYYGKDNVWNSLATYKSDQPPKLKNASFSPHSQYIDISWNMFEARITDSHDGKKYPLSLQTYVDISYHFGDTSSNGWKTLYIGNGTYDATGNEVNPPFETFRIYGLQTTDYSNNSGYTIDFTNKPDPISSPLASFDQNHSFDLRLYGVNQSGVEPNREPNYVYLYGISLEPTGAPGPVEVIATRDFQQNQFTMGLSFALNSLNPSTTTGIDITQYDVSFHMVESKRFASADPIDHSGVYQIVWDGISGLSNTEIDLSNLYPGAKYDVMVRAQNRGLAGVDGSYGETAFTSTDFTNVGATQYITLNDLEPVNPQGMTFTLVNSASIRCCISGNNTLANKTIMNSNGEIDISGTSDFYVNFGKQGVDMSGAGVLVNVSLKKIGNSPVSIPMYYSDSEGDTSYSFLGYTIGKGAYQDKGDSSKNEGFVYGSSMHISDDSNKDFNTYFSASITAYNLKYTIQFLSNNTSISRTHGQFYVDGYIKQSIVSFSNPPTLTVANYTALFGIPSIHQLQLTADVHISNFANCIIPHDSSDNHSFIDGITNNSYSFSSSESGKITSIEEYIIHYSEISDISSSSGTYEPTTMDSFVTNVHYLDHSSDAPIVGTDVTTTDISNLGVLFKDSYTSYVGLDVHTFIYGVFVSDSPIDPETYIAKSDDLIYFNGKFVSGGYNTLYNGNKVYAFSDWSTGHAIQGTNYADISNEGNGGFKWIAVNITSLKLNSKYISSSHFRINDEFLDTSHFGISYEAYLMKKTSISDNGVFGALNGQHNFTKAEWYSQNWTDRSLSVDGNGVYFNGNLLIDDSDLNSQYFFIIGLPNSGEDYFTVHI